MVLRRSDLLVFGRGQNLQSSQYLRKVPQISAVSEYFEIFSVVVDTLPRNAHYRSLREGS